VSGAEEGGTVSLEIRPVRDSDVEALVELTLLAFVPVFESFEALLGPSIYRHIWPDWRKCQSDGVKEMCREAAKNPVLVAEVDGRPVGLVAYSIDAEADKGQTIFLAVHPEHQCHGVGTELNRRALQEIERAGVRLAVVETGGDPSHAPARRSYEKAGYTLLPLARYFVVFREDGEDG
jgi:ribosomal protein S18 acetylase RimI-like enzyme